MINYFVLLVLLLSTSAFGQDKKIIRVNEKRLEARIQELARLGKDSSGKS